MRNIHFGHCLKLIGPQKAKIWLKSPIVANLLLLLLRNMNRNSFSSTVNSNTDYNTARQFKYICDKSFMTNCSEIVFILSKSMSV